MLEVRGLSVRYGPITAVHELSFTVDSGQLVSIIGPNGAGKTSTMMAIGGIVPAASGEIWFEDERIDGLPSHRIYERGIVQVPEGRMILAGMSVLENLRLGADFGSQPAQFASRLEGALDLFPELGHRLRDCAGVLSGGQMQMLAIARGLMAAPKLLMLDEPSLGLAPKLAEQLFTVVSRLLKDGLTILLVEQNVRAVLNMASSVILLEAGNVRGRGVPDTILNSVGLREAYLGQGVARRRSSANSAITEAKG